MVLWFFFTHAGASTAFHKFFFKNPMNVVETPSSGIGVLVMLRTSFKRIYIGVAITGQLSLAKTTLKMATTSPMSLAKNVSYIRVVITNEPPYVKTNKLLMRKKGADQLRSNCEADQRLCFRYTDSTIPLLLKSEISSLSLSSVLVQAGLCRTCSETTWLVFPRGGSNILPLRCPLANSDTIL